MDPHALADRLLAVACAYPGAFEDHPWGDTVAKVDGKIFVFLGVGEPDAVHLTVKLPDRAADVLATYPFAKPTGYGLGKWGWVSLTVPPGAVEEAQLAEWIDLSYRAIAKKKRIKELDARR